MWSAGTPVFDGCAFLENTSDEEGGAVYLNSSDVSFTNCTFLANHTDLTDDRDGGALCSYNSRPEVVNCLFAHNSTKARGGAIFVTGYSLTAVNCTIANNTCTGTYTDEAFGGGIFLYGVGADISNCIAWGNSDYSGNSQSAQIYKDPSHDPSVSYTNTDGSWYWPGGTGNISADPLFVDADGPDNIPGTVDDDFRLSANSPCIDAGDNDAVPAGVVTDVAGVYRWIDEPSVPNTGNGDRSDRGHGGSRSDHRLRRGQPADRIRRRRRR